LRWRRLAGSRRSWQQRADFHCRHHRRGRGQTLPDRRRAHAGARTTAKGTDYVAAWKTWPAVDAAGRERLWQAVNLLGKVKDHLACMIADGKLRSGN
jgi:hypothetical protein